MTIIARPTANAAAHGAGPNSFTINKPIRVERRWPPINARGCAGSAFGEPNTVTIDVANGSQQGKCGGGGEYLHASDRNCAASSSRKDGKKLSSLEHVFRNMKLSLNRGWSKRRPTVFRKSRAVDGILADASRAGPGRLYDVRIWVIRDRAAR